MGMPAQRAKRWSVADVQALPDEPGVRFETVDGELVVTPAPAFGHQRVVGLLYLALAAWCRQTRVAEVIFAPADVELDEFTLVQPDLFVLPRIGGGVARRFSDVGRLLLAIEVSSPGTARYDRVVKRPRFQRADAEYWIVDPDARLVERWVPQDARPLIVTERLDWTAGDAAPLVIDLPALFAEAQGET